MIYSVDVSSSEVVVGQPITIEVKADSAVQISVACFVDKPPPPRFKDCRECSVQMVQSGQPFTVTPRADTWRNHSGEYRFKVQDAAGNAEIAVVRVLSDADSAGGKTMTM